MATKRKTEKRVTYCVEVDRGCEWRWDDEFPTLAAARRERSRLRFEEEDESVEMRIVKVTREVVR